MHATKLHRPSVSATGLSDALLSATVKAQSNANDLSHRVSRAARRAEGRLAARLDIQDDTGAQAAEYAMMSGVGVAIAAAIIAILRRGDIIKRLVTALVEVLISFVQSWFGG